MAAGLNRSTCGCPIPNVQRHRRGGVRERKITEEGVGGWVEGKGEKGGREERNPKLYIK